MGGGRPANLICFAKLNCLLRISCPCFLIDARFVSFARCVSRAFSAQKDFINKVDEIFIRDIYLIYFVRCWPIFSRKIFGMFNFTTYLLIIERKIWRTIAICTRICKHFLDIYALLTVMLEITGLMGYFGIRQTIVCN